MVCMDDNAVSNRRNPSNQENIRATNYYVAEIQTGDVNMLK